MRPHGWSDHWHAARVARRLVMRHGFTEARRRALRQRNKHTTMLNGERCATNHFRWIYWDLVAIDTGRVPEPARFALERAS